MVGSYVGMTPPPSAWSPDNSFQFKFRGMVTGTVFEQVGGLGPSPGQQSLWATRTQPYNDRVSWGGDVRQTRLNFAVKGPQVLGATPLAVTEVDFFGGLGAGNYGYESIVPRLRLAFVQLEWPSMTRFVVGQMNTLSFWVVPESVAHVAFPLGFGSGLVGWRYPGVWFFQTFCFDSAKNNTLEFAASATRTGWTDAPAAYGDNTPNAATNPYYLGLGDASGIPQLEARLVLNLKSPGFGFTFGLLGHYDWKDLSGVGRGVGVAPPGCSATSCTGGGTTQRYNNINGEMFETYARFVIGPVTAWGGYNRSRAEGGIIASVLQYGDILSYGWWAQLGLNLTRELSIWGWAGEENPDDAMVRRWLAKPAITGGPASGTPTVAANGIVQNNTYAAMIRYMDNNYAMGLEWVNFYTQYTAYPATAGVPPIPYANSHAYQIMFSVSYYMN
ncbi:MAG TPA: hypothetical protein VEJ89_08330 [Myxococcaceae bacterium]|nr:hypothetical protein [Myxococcaceae bacterium]